MDPETRFRTVFELAYAPLCRYTRHRGLTGPDAEDLVAQTLEIAWRRIGDVPAEEPLPWLYAVAHNVWRNTVRRDRRWHELLARSPGTAWLPPRSPWCWAALPLPRAPGCTAPPPPGGPARHRPGPETARPAGT